MFLVVIITVDWSIDLLLMPRNHSQHDCILYNSITQKTVPLPRKTIPPMPHTLSPDSCKLYPPSSQYRNFGSAGTSSGISTYQKFRVQKYNYFMDVFKNFVVLLRLVK